MQDCVFHQRDKHPFKERVGIDLNPFQEKFPRKAAKVGVGDRKKDDVLHILPPGRVHPNVIELLREAE